ncbi:MAG: radical SAM protein [Thermoplasmata archaeon]
MVEYEVYRAKRILIVHKKVDEGWYWNKYAAHPYVGCFHGCHFCYSRAEKYMQYPDPTDFAERIKVKINAHRLLRKELPRVERNVIVTGDYQPAEKKFGLSRKMLKVVRDLRFPVHIVERSPYLMKDLDILEDIRKQTWCCISFSFSTVDEGLSRLLEFRAPSPRSRMRAIRELAKRGFLVGLSYMPIVPYITDSIEMMEETIATAKENGAKFVLCASMTMESWQRDWLMDFLRENFPELVDRYEDLYAGNSYEPRRDYTNEIMKRASDLCKRYDIDERIPRPVFDEGWSKQASLDSWNR